MKANELMIGDWVAVHRPGDRHEQVRVKSVIGNGTIEAKTSDGLVAIGELAVEPIPLTSDILNKNFPDVRHGIAWCWDDTKSTDNETWYELRTLDIDGIELCVNIRYVHELQNLMRMLGIEEEVVL